MTYQGRRIEIKDETKNNVLWVETSLDGIEPGDYWKHKDGTWGCAIPNPKIPEYKSEYFILPVCGSLKNHTVFENEDGTITVSPSILNSTNWGPDKIYHEIFHGYLENGIWRDC